MTTHRKPTAREELERIESALVECILEASEQELREDLAAEGSNPDVCVANVDVAIARARAECARQRMETARAELAAWRGHGGKSGKISRDEARARLQQLRSGDADLNTRMMMAARKGDGLSESDLEGLLDDLAELERLEREDGNE